tara:strand:+ start:435 stop:671 length:237 start_codon:yes stop_codon:yes gene_type:complete
MCDYCVIHYYYSWVLRDPCFKTPTALGVWETFQTAVTEARANPALHLTDNEGSDLVFLFFYKCCMTEFLQHLIPKNVI